MRWSCCLALLLLAAPAARPDEPDDTPSVRVTDTKGRPVVGAAVFPQPAKDRMAMILAEHTGRDGVLRLPGLDRRQTYSLHVRPPDDREDLSDVHVHEWVPAAGLTVELPAGRTITGRVVDAQGRAVVAWLHYATSRREGVMRTEPDGTFELRSLPGEDARVLALPKRGPRHHEGPLADDGTWTAVPLGQRHVRVVLSPAREDPRSRDLAVSVVGPDGNPPARVHIEWRHSRGSETHPADEGTTTFRTAPERGEVTAYAAVDGLGNALCWAPARVRVDAGEDTVRVEMPEGRTLVGTVVDERGAPQPDVWVKAWPLGDGERFGDDELARAITRADGRFRLLGLGPEDVEVGSAGAAGRPASRRIPASPGARDVRVVVRRAESVELRVVDATGEPVAGAEVIVRAVRRAPGRSITTTLFTGTTASDGRVRPPSFEPSLEYTLEVKPPKGSDGLRPLESRTWTPRSGDLTLLPH
jgi:hypothetical protein